MSHFVRCDRCEKEEWVTGTLKLPPGWERVLNADLCEPCMLIVRDFIQFKPSRAAELTVDPVPAEIGPIEPATDKLFETATQQDSAEMHQVSEHASNGELVPNNAPVGEPEGNTQPVSAECSTEERVRTRVARRKFKGQDPAPDPTQTDPPAVQP